MSNKISEVLSTSMEKVRQMVDANTVVGTPIEVGGATLIPISKIGFTLGAGGWDGAAKATEATGGFGGGSGCGVKITPIAFLIIQGERVRMLPVAEPASTATERVIEQIPALVDKLTELLGKKDDISEI